jgi:PAS domain S-box-containing protein
MAAIPTSPPPRLSFSLPLDPARLLRARHRVRDYLNEHVADAEAIDAVVLAVEEAMTNAVRHSGARDELDIMLHFEGADLIAEVRDRGGGFDLASFDPQRRPDPQAPSGRGLYLIARLMDDVRLRCDGGLEVRAVKRDVLCAAPTGPRPRELQAAVPGARDYRDARQRALLEEIDESFVALDWEYRYTHLNEAGLRLQGRSRDELLGRRIWDVRPGLRDTPLGVAIREATELGRFALVEYVSDITGEWHEARVYPTSSGVSVFARGIDERKRREAERDDLLAALGGSEERYAAIFATAPFALALSDASDGALVDANDAFLELFEYDRDEVLGRTSVELGIAGADSREQVAVELATRGYVRDFEVTRTSGSGARLILSLNLDRVTIAGQRYILTTIVNVTEQKVAEAAREANNEELAAALEELQAAEEELRAQNEELTASRQALFESDERFRLALRNAPVSVSVQDRDLRYVWAFNQRGATPEQIIGKRDADLFTPDEAVQLTAIKRRVLEQDVEIHEEMWLERPDGRMYLSVNFEPLRDAAGLVTGVGAATIDLTAMKLAEEALAASRARLQTTLESMTDAVFVSDLEGRITDFNEAFATFHRLTDSDETSRIIGHYRSILELSHADGTPAPLDERPVERALRGETATNQEYLLRRKDTGETWVGSYSLAPIRGGDGAIVGSVVVGRDVTEQKRVAAERDELLRSFEYELAATRLLARVAQLASGSLSVEEVAEQVLTGIRDDLGDLQAGSVYALEPDGTRLRHLALFGYPAEMLPSIEELALDDDSNVGRVAVTREVLTHEAPDEPRGTLRRRRQMGLEDSRWLALPIERAGDLVGVMALFFSGRRPFGDDELRLYRGVAAILGNAIANARLYEREVAGREAETERAARIEALHAVARAAAGSLDTGEVAQHVVDELGRLFDITLATIFVADEGRGELVRQAAYGHPAETLASALPFALDSDLESTRVHRSGAAIAVEDTEAADRAGVSRAGLQSAAQPAGRPTRSYLILPLTAYDRTLGTLNVAWPEPRRFNDDDLAFFTAVAQEVAVSLENARLHEQQQHIAATLQEHLLHALPAIAGLDLAALSTPAYQPELIGGDFHDVFELPGGAVYALIGDVMGKGVTAAGLTETVRSSIRALALGATPPEDVLRDLNLLLQRGEHEQFVSALLLKFDPRTRQGRLASGGHPPAIRLSAAGAAPVEARGPLLGTFEDRFAAVDLTLAPGDALVLYTDGITEARRAGELFGERRLQQVVGGLSGKPAAAIAEAVRAAALEFAGVLRDDFEILVLRV